MDSTNVSTLNNASSNSRKPKLPTKLQKYLAFAFFFSNSLIDNNLISHDNFHLLLHSFKAFDDFHSQFSFLNDFDLHFKTHLKSLYSFLKERSKAEKPKKQRKSKKTDTVVTNETTTDTAEKPKKQHKSKKTDTVVTNENSEEITETTEVSTVEKPKKQRKSKKEKTTESTDNNEEITEQNKPEKKPRKTKKEKKGSQDTEEKTDLIHELLTLANSEDNE